MNFEAEEFDEKIDQLQAKKRQVTRVVICAMHVPTLFRTNLQGSNLVYLTWGNCSMLRENIPILTWTPSNRFGYWLKHPTQFLNFYFFTV